MVIDPGQSPAVAAARRRRPRLPFLFDPSQRAAAVVAAVVLVVSSAASWWLYQLVDGGDDGTLAPPGLVFVQTPDTTDFASALDASLLYGATPDASSGKAQVAVEVTMEQPPPAGVRLTWCGPVSQGLGVAQPGMFRSGQPLSAATVRPRTDPPPAEGIASAPCVDVDLGPADGSRRVYRVSLLSDASWGTASGVIAAYAFPGMLLLRGGTPTGTVEAIGFPADLHAYESTPGASTPPATWAVDVTHPATEYLLTADSREAQATEQRLNILLGLVLGIAGSAIIWLFEIAVDAISRRREEEELEEVLEERAEVAAAERDPPAPDDGSGPQPRTRSDLGS